MIDDRELSALVKVADALREVATQRCYGLVQNRDLMIAINEYDKVRDGIAALRAAGCEVEDDGGERRDAMKTGIELIAAERERQVSKEGWTPEHDDQHTDGSLAVAAACYALNERGPLEHRHYFDVPVIWPWHVLDWKPTPDDPVRELVKAGALIAAEIDRLLRAPGAEGGE